MVLDVLDAVDDVAELLGPIPFVLAVDHTGERDDAAAENDANGRRRRSELAGEPLLDGGAGARFVRATARVGAAAHAPRCPVCCGLRAGIRSQHQETDPREERDVALVRKCGHASFSREHTNGRARDIWERGQVRRWTDVATCNASKWDLQARRPAP